MKMQQIINIHLKETVHNFVSNLMLTHQITEMDTKGINTKIIKEYIGHSDIKPTLRYVKPSKVDIKEALIR